MSKTLTLKTLGNHKIENEKVFKLLDIFVNGTFSDFDEDLPRKVGFNQTDFPILASHLRYMVDLGLIESEIEHSESLEVAGESTFGYPHVTGKGHGYLKVSKSPNLLVTIQNYSCLTGIESFPLDILLDIAPDALKNSVL